MRTSIIFFAAVTAAVMISCSCSKGNAGPDTEPVLPQITVSELKTTGGHTYVQVDGQPFTFMGAQIRLDALLNCDKLDMPGIKQYFAKAKELGLNCVQVPVSWKMIEPARDAYDFSTVDAVMGFCNEYGLKMELLWFSTNMCGDSFTYLLPTYTLSVPEIKLFRNDEGQFWNYYGYQYFLILDNQWLLERETKAVGRLFSHIRYWDSVNGNLHPVITCQVHNEPDGFVRWRLDQKAIRYKDGSPLSKEKAWEMTLNALNTVGNAVKNSPYKVLTRVNIVKGQGIDAFPEAPSASPADVSRLEGIDFVSVDIYRNDVSEVVSEVNAYRSLPANYPLVGENKGSYSHSPSLILAAIAAGGGYDIYDLATSKFFIDNTDAPQDVDHGVYTWDLKEKEGITAGTRKIATGIALASEDIALAGPENMAAFNISKNEPEVNIQEEAEIQGLNIKYKTSAGAIGFAVNRGSYVVLYSTGEAEFLLKTAGGKEIVVKTSGMKIIRNHDIS